MPFDARVGNEMTYQAAKPSNWQPGMITFDIHKKKVFSIFFIGDYTQEEPEHLRPKLSEFYIKNLINNFVFYT